MVSLSSGFLAFACIFLFILNICAAGHSNTLGINVHRPSGDLATKLFDKVKESGLRWVRIDVCWDEIESQKGAFNWEKSDDTIRSATERGLLIYASLQGTPKWANGGKDSRVQPRNVSDWVNFCKEFSQRYDGNHGVPKVEFFGIWNEPDGNGFGDKGDNQDKKASDYINNILLPGSKALRNVRKDAKIAAPDLASNPDFLEKVLDKAKNAIDIVTIHKYSDDPANIVKYSQRISDLLKKKSARKDIWLTETGWSTKTSKGCWSGMVDEKTQSENLLRVLQSLSNERLVQMVFIYELLDDDSKGACQWGILKSDFTEKIAFREIAKSIQRQNSQAS